MLRHYCVMSETCTAVTHASLKYASYLEQVYFFSIMWHPFFQSLQYSRKKWSPNFMKNVVIWYWKSSQVKRIKKCNCLKGLSKILIAVLQYINIIWSSSQLQETILFSNCTTPMKPLLTETNFWICLLRSSRTLSQCLQEVYHGCREDSAVIAKHSFLQYHWIPFFVVNGAFDIYKTSDIILYWTFLQ